MDDNDSGQPKAGQTVTPTGSQPQTGQPQDAQQSGQPAPAPQAESQPPQPAPAQGSQDSQDSQEPQVELGTETDTGDTVTDDGQAPDERQQVDDNGAAISWTASEFIDHDKRAGWYAILLLSALAFAGLVYLISKDVISVSVVLVAALVFGVYAGHKPRQMEYRLDSGGLNIGQKHFHWDDFRSFSVMEEGAVPSIVFMPLKRFAVPTTIYYPPEEEDKIVSILVDRLPMEQRDHDAIDRLMHRIRY